MLQKKKMNQKMRLDKIVNLLETNPDVRFEHSFRHYSPLDKPIKTIKKSIFVDDYIAEINGNKISLRRIVETKYYREDYSESIIDNIIVRSGKDFFSPESQYSFKSEEIKKNDKNGYRDIKAILLDLFELVQSRNGPSEI